jgi:hypothetical protein
MVNLLLRVDKPCVGTTKAVDQTVTLAPKRALWVRPPLGALNGSRGVVASARQIVALKVRVQFSSVTPCSSTHRDPDGREPRCKRGEGGSTPPRCSSSSDGSRGSIAERWDVAPETRERNPSVTQKAGYPRRNVMSIIVEIRAAEGGLDAKQLVQDQFGVYVKRAALRGL